MIDWLTTIPGILITCGAILLIISIILFIAGAKKSKKEERVNTNIETNANFSKVSNEEAVVDIKPIDINTSVNNNIENTTSNNVNNNIVTDTNNVNETISSNIIQEPVINVVPTQEEVVNPIPVENTVVEPINMEIPTIQEEPKVIPTEPTAIYGGEMPTVDFSVKEEKPVTIYGGNDPLEATQTLPKMEESHLPYGGNYSEVKIVEPTVEQPIQIPVEETVANIPVIEPAKITESVNPAVAPVQINTEEKENIIEEL